MRKIKMTQRAIVTGGCGFIGSHFIQLLIEKYGFEVLNVDKLTYASDSSVLDKLSESSSYTFLKEDICNQKVLFNHFRDYKPDVVFHLAAESHVDRSITSAAPFMQTNILGTYALLEILFSLLKSNHLPTSFRFIHISTDEVYGSLSFDDKSSSENSVYNPSSPYSASKASSDLLVNAWIKTYNFPGIITHCTNNYGEYQHDEKLIPTIIRCAIQNKPIPIYGNGKNVRDWLYVKDHCEALLTIFLKGRLGEVYNISAYEEKSNNEVATHICKLLDQLFPRPDQKSYFDQVHYTQDRLGHDLRYSLSHKKIKRDLLWHPQISFEQGLTKTILWYTKKYCEDFYFAESFI